MLSERLSRFIQTGSSTKSGDNHSLMALCADDIELWPPDAQPLLGRAAVSAQMARGMTKSTPLRSLTFVFGFERDCLLDRKLRKYVFVGRRLDLQTSLRKPSVDAAKADRYVGDACFLQRFHCFSHASFLNFWCLHFLRAAVLPIHRQRMLS